MAAVSVPTRFTEQGMPFGITLAARGFSDRMLLSIANRIQQCCTLALGALDLPMPSLNTTPVTRTDRIDIVVCGAHMRHMALNWQLTQRGAQFREATTTAPEYHLYALDESPVARPALIRVLEAGLAIEVEVWSLPTAEWGSFLAGIAAPLGLGKVSLVDGRSVCGFIAEASATADAVDISEHGGWRNYLENKR
jgi:allophanate hydrolase